MEITERNMAVKFKPGLENEFETFKWKWFASVYEGILGGEGVWGKCVAICAKGERFNSLFLITPSKERSYSRNFQAQICVAGLIWPLKKKKCVWCSN